MPPGESPGRTWAIDGVLGYEDWTLAGYDGGVLLVSGAQPPIADAHYLADIFIEKLRLAPDGSIWAIGFVVDTNEDESHNLYRIDPAEVVKP